METGTFIKWNDNLIANRFCYGLYLKQIDHEKSEVICTNVGDQRVKMKIQIETKLIQVNDEQV